MSRNLRLLIVLVIVATAAAYTIFVVIPSQVARRSYAGARQLAEDVRKAFQVTPEVRVNNVIVLNQQSTILELAVMQQSFEHRYTWENTWLGSKKKIFITGTFNAKVGFDLRERFAITLRDDRAYVRLPAPRTLSVEGVGDITYRDDQGIWNWVDVEDRTRATNAFVRDARRYADRAEFKNDAKARMEEELKSLLAPYADAVVVSFITESGGAEPR